VVKGEIDGRIQEIARTPTESSTQKLAHMMPISWGAECGAYIQWVYEVIDMIYSAISPVNWSLVDCQEYIVDLEMSVTKAVAELEVAAQDQLREDREEIIQAL
jgi:hypothetical protein